MFVYVCVYSCVFCLNCNKSKVQNDSTTSKNMERLKIEWKLHFPSLCTLNSLECCKNTAQICYVNAMRKDKFRLSDNIDNEML